MISKEDKILIIAFHANDKRDNSLVAGLRPYYLHRFFVRKKCNVKLFHRFNTNNNTKECNLYPVDGLFWWSIISFFKLKKEIENSDVVITSSPPHSLSIIGLLCKLFFKNKKWIHDLRDLWTDNNLRSRNPYKVFSNIILEKIVFNKVDVLLANTIYDKKIYSIKTNKKIVVVRNGSSLTDKNYDKRIGFVYFGGTTKGAAIKPISKLFSFTKVDFYGENSEEFKLYKNLNFFGSVSYNRASVILSKYKYGIIYLPKGYELGGRINQKIYDYIACGLIPIIINGSAEMNSLLPENMCICISENDSISPEKLSDVINPSADFINSVKRENQFKKILI